MEQGGASFERWDSLIHSSHMLLASTCLSCWPEATSAFMCRSKIAIAKLSYSADCKTVPETFAAIASALRPLQSWPTPSKVSQSPFSLHQARLNTNPLQQARAQCPRLLHQHAQNAPSPSLPLIPTTLRSNPATHARAFCTAHAIARKPIPRRTRKFAQAVRRST